MLRLLKRQKTSSKILRKNLGSFICASVIRSGEKAFFSRVKKLIGNRLIKLQSPHLIYRVTQPLCACLIFLSSFFRLSFCCKKITANSSEIRGYEILFYDFAILRSGLRSVAHNQIKSSGRDFAETAIAV